jgi:mono/diheme cytochrome c family protein
MMQKQAHQSITALALHLTAGFFVAAMLAACGANAATRTPLPTVTAIPTFAYVSPTEAPEIQTAVAATALAASTAAQTTPTPDAGRIALGSRVYTMLECGGCHGEKGAGVAGKGAALVPLTLTEGEFITVLRTGGSVGNDHLFASNRLSTTGGKALYLYVVSLGK